MSRRRYISTDISIDSKLADLSRLAVILYTWGIPHASDDCRLTAKNAAECRWMILPNQKCNREEVEEAILELLDIGLWGIDEEGHFFYPSDSFYKYQTYISKSNQRKTPQNAAKRRKTPQNAVSSSSSPSPPLPSPSSLSFSIDLQKDLLPPSSEQGSETTKAPWSESLSFVKSFLENEAPASTHPELLFDSDWWVDVYDGINGFDLDFLAQEFARMSAWLTENPQRRPLPKANSIKRFVRRWLTTTKEKERKKRYV